MTAKIVGGTKIAGALAAAVAKSKTASSLGVGFFPKDTYAPTEGRPEELPVAAVAYWNEFGTATMPPRPFMRPTAKDGEKTWGKLAEVALKHSDGDAYKALMIMGGQIQADVVEHIKDVVSPPNSMVTNILKDRFPLGDYTPADVWKAFEDAKNGVTAPAGKPLVWSRTLINSVDFGVE